MLELAAILSAYLSFALFHAADPARLPRRLSSVVSAFDAWRLGARLAGGLFAALSLLLWSLGADGAVVWTGPLCAWMLAGAFIVLTRPLAERLVWGVAVACPPAIVLLSLSGGFYGG